MDSSGTGFGPALNAPEFDELAAVSEQPERDRRAVRVLWSQRRFIFRFTLLGLLLSVAVAFLIRPQYQSTVRLMPPDSSSDFRVGMFMQLVGGAGGLAADLLGRKSSGDVLLEILRSRTLEEQLINQFDLRKVYGAKLMMDARVTLLSHTKIIVAQKSGVISITVTDRDRERAMRLAQAYVNQLDHFVAALNTWPPIASASSSRSGSPLSSRIWTWPAATSASSPARTAPSIRSSKAKPWSTPLLNCRANSLPSNPN